ncbi:elongation factor 2 [Entomortierella parvispora]|uniref:Elongation factor 2 n=1 Tax=Entomortierella parvispora TaxID=205924 RepID=A0A9P3H732_9FUNG|nr:elongation factor 2 [Entomortierella parvispora]
MVALSLERILELMRKPTNIRNVAVFAQKGHGATELMDTLSVSEAHIRCLREPHTCLYPPPPNKQKADMDHPVTVQPTILPLHLKLTEEDLLNIKQEANGPEFLINLFYPPRHIDLTSGVIRNLLATDGALILTNCLDPIPSSTMSALRRVVDERVKPVLVLNQIDRVFEELSLSQEDLYQGFAWTIQSANNVTASCNPSKDIFERVIFDPVQGTVVFASGLHGWAFTLQQFADRYAQKFPVNRAKLVKRLWGNYHFDVTTKSWTERTVDADGQPLARGFNLFVLDPILKLFDAILHFKTDTYEELLRRLEIHLSESEKELSGKPLLRVVLQKFLPASDTLLRTAVLHLPSPVTAQKYRVDTLYGGPMNDECAVGIRNCDPEGPLMMHISKMIRTADKDRFYGLGRIFSGTIRAGARVRIMGPCFKSGSSRDLYIHHIQRLVLLMSSTAEPVGECSAGNVVGVVGIDQFLLQSGTISSSDCADTIKDIHYSITPLVQVKVDAKDSKDLPKLLESLKNLSRMDPLVTTLILETGEHVVAAEGERQLWHLFQDLEGELGEVQIVKSDPFTQYRETVQAESRPALAKSPNKHNRLFMKAMPLGDDVTHAIERGDISPNFDLKSRARIMSDDYEWDNQEARKIWSFGPDSVGPNLLVNCTRGVAYLNEVKESIVAGFQWTTREAVFTEEPMRGCRLNILDVVMSSDAIHRGGGQIIPTARSAIYASTMMARPGIMEPVFDIAISCPERVMANVIKTLVKHRGEVVNEEFYFPQRTGDNLLMVKAVLPVAESFGIQSKLSMATGDQATVIRMAFNHWKLMPGVSNEDPQLIELISSIRRRKGFNEALPALDRFLDRL